MALLVSFSSLWLVRYVDPRFSWLLELSSTRHGDHLLPAELADSHRTPPGWNEVNRRDFVSMLGAVVAVGQSGGRSAGLNSAASAFRLPAFPPGRTLVLGDGAAGSPDALPRVGELPALKPPLWPWRSCVASRPALPVR